MLSQVRTHLAIAGLLAGFLALAGLYAARVPAWNAPDEPAHYNYIRQIAEQHTLPVLVAGDYDFALLERLKSARFPLSESVDAIRYEGWQPPLYYLLSAPVYWTTASLPLTQRVFALRMVSALFGAMVLLVAYATVGRILGRQAGLAAAAFIGTIPMFVFISGSINNDTLGVLLLSAILGVLVASLVPERQPAEGGTQADAPRRIDRTYLLLGILLGLAALAKSTAYMAAGLVALVALLPRPGRSWTGDVLPGALRRLAVAYGTAALISGWWFVRNIWVYGGFDFMARQRHDSVVTGQPTTGAITWDAVQNLGTVAFRSFWAQFGWMGVLVDQRIYEMYGALTLLAVIGTGWWLLRIALCRHRIGRGQARALLLLLCSGILTAAGLAYYNLAFIQAQGRYLFTALIPISVLFCLGLSQWVPGRIRLPAACIWLAGMAALDVACLFRFILPDLVR